MNVNKVEALHDKPILKYINNILSCQNKDELWILMSKMHNYDFPFFFNFYPEIDAKNSKLVVLNLSTSGLGLPEKKYYFEKDKEDTRKKYKEYITNISGIKSNNIIFDIETKLAELTYERVQMRDPHLNYNKMSIEELSSISNLDYNSFIKNITNKKIEFIIVDNPSFYKNLGILWNNTDLEKLKLFLKYKFFSMATPFLSSKFVDIKFNFYSKFLRGQEEDKPRWEKCISIIGMCIGDLLSKLYVEKYFSKESKNKMINMVNNLNKTLKKRIINLDWMSEETKKALLKMKHSNAK